MNDNEWNEKLPTQQQTGANYGLIFSRWGPADIWDVAIPKDEKSFAEAAAYEGEFCSVRRHFNWTKGVYSLRLRNLKREESENRKGTWVAFEIDEGKTGTTTMVGCLLFRHEEDELRLSSRSMYNFLEIYGESNGLQVDNYCPMRYEVRAARLNGTLVPEKDSTVSEYWRHVPLFAKCTTEKKDESKWNVTTSFAEQVFDHPSQEINYGRYNLC